VPRKPVWVWDYGYANTSLVGMAGAFGMKMRHKAGRGFALSCLNPTFRMP
jgi:hypothetical protein